MDVAGLLADAFDRIREEVHAVLDGVQQGYLTFQPDHDSNTIAWLVWHLTRIQDDHVAAGAGRGQTWIVDGWNERFRLPFDDPDTGYGHGPKEVLAVTATSEVLTGYHDAVHHATMQFVRTLDDAALDRVVDERWDPPVTLAVRLVSVISDDLQHVGQAAYLRGLAERTDGAGR